MSSKEDDEMDNTFMSSKEDDGIDNTLTQEEIKEMSMKQWIKTTTILDN